MNATPPEASSEYSRGFSRRTGALRGLLTGGSGHGDTPPKAIRTGILAGVWVGAFLLLVAEFTVLFTVHTAATSATVDSVGTGSHHSYALIPIALLAAVLAAGFYRDASRPALFAVGLLGVIALLITVLGDLPDARAHGITHNFVLASASPAAGLYLEALGGVVLLASAGLGFLLLGSPRSREHPA
jgi:hypothetical protein